jgi:hypothetical protein
LLPFPAWDGRRILIAATTTCNQRAVKRLREAEASCSEGNANIVIGSENYFLSADGLLMPAKKDQPPPDLKYFKKQPLK